MCALLAATYPRWFSTAFWSFLGCEFDIGARKKLAKFQFLRYSNETNAIVGACDAPLSWNVIISNGWPWHWAMAWNVRKFCFYAQFFINFSEYHPNMDLNSKIGQHRTIQEGFKHLEKKIIKIGSVVREETGWKWSVSHAFLYFWRILQGWLAELFPQNEIFIPTWNISRNINSKTITRTIYSCFRYFIFYFFAFLNINTVCQFFSCAYVKFASQKTSEGCRESTGVGGGAQSTNFVSRWPWDHISLRKIKFKKSNFYLPSHLNDAWRVL